MNINLTLIGQMIAFVIFVWFCVKYVWPPITQALAEREKKIAEGLSAADRAKEELERTQAQAEELLKQHRADATQLIEQARSRANKMIEEARETARTEAQQIIENARGQIQQEVENAKTVLRSQVAALVIKGTERIVETSVDEKQHAALLNELATEL